MANAKPHMMHVNRKYLEGENGGFQNLVWIVCESDVLTIKSEVKLADTQSGWIFDMYDRGL